MMLAARCLILDVPTTRTGLVRLTTYLRKIMIDPVGCDGGSPYLPDKLCGKPWFDAFLKVLTKRLRSMGDELSDEGRGEPTPTGREPTLTDFLTGLRAYFEHQFSMGFTTAQVFDMLEETYRRADNALAARKVDPA